MFEKILVALDGSKHSDKTLDSALDIAKRYSADLELLSVIPPINAPLGPYPIVGTPYLSSAILNKCYQETKTGYEHVLSKAMQKAKKYDSNLKVSSKLVDGHPAEKILEVAKEEKCNLIIIGSHGLGGIKKFLLGSVSQRVVKQAKCSILIVK